MLTEVFIREKNEYKEVEITDPNKPAVSVDLLSKWTRIVNSTAEILEIPAVLIMKIRKNKMEVLLSSENSESPYSAGDSDSLGHGLYCENVIGTNKELLVENALESDVWNDNPDVDLNMIAYYGLPIRWPDGQTFGTICVLDNKSNEFEEKYREMINIYQKVIEDDLELLMFRNKL
jgi:transcriptional regulator with GAF, ATPase, and Fis domain